MPKEILAFELIARAGVSENDHKLIMTGLDFGNKEV